jgi:hypothetical protein
MKVHITVQTTIVQVVYLLLKVLGTKVFRFGEFLGFEIFAKMS